jgi:hypothetical protein
MDITCFGVSIVMHTHLHWQSLQGTASGGRYMMLQHIEAKAHQ